MQADNVQDDDNQRTRRLAWDAIYRFQRPLSAMAIAVSIDRHPNNVHEALAGHEWFAQIGDKYDIALSDGSAMFHQSSLNTTSVR